MTKSEQYGLTFSKQKTTGFSAMYNCGGSDSIAGSLILANMLEVLSDRESDGFLEEVDLAISNGDFIDVYRPDSSSVDVFELIPPNAVINGSFTIALIDLKELLEEWIDYINNH